MADQPRFAHASEAELARILDYYQVSWQYEPRTFPILWNLEGTVVESFSPDFYLPEMDLYVELTTLKQSLVRRKNRKIRRLRELYPDVRAKLFYGKDFKALMLKYGRFDLAASLSGLEGQTMKAPPVVRPNALPPAGRSLPTAPATAPATAHAGGETSPAPVADRAARPAATADRRRAAPARSDRAGRKRPSRGTRRRRGRRGYVPGPESEARSEAATEVESAVAGAAAAEAAESGAEGIEPR